ncbi:hypothetical protein B7486_66395 [cyanobacterium TDX16]|nr:hypothetical protein B7486_66395 [cyanobacterium TDX16]
MDIGGITTLTLVITILTIVLVFGSIAFTWWLVAKMWSSTPGFQPIPPPSHADGWYPDPTGRHQERWFRAGQWSSQVRDGGAAGPVDDDPI